MGNYHHCYKMTWDTGSAPNPYHDVLTLAICKPGIRKHSQVGDWISGWTGKNVHGKDGKSHFFNEQKLIYLAKIKEKLTFAEYWERFPQKRPQIICCNQEPTIKKTCGGISKVANAIYNSGDNIYKPIGNGKFQQLENGNGHDEKDMERDLKGEFVLICEEFYYYGVDNTLDVSKDIFNVTVPRWKKMSESDSSKLIDFVRNDNHATIKGNV